MSTNPMQRIADLEAQVASLTAANEKLRTNGNGHADVEALIKQGFDRFGQDYTGKLAGLIQPFIENTVRRCKETEEKQTALEEKFKKHRAAVSKSADDLVATFNAVRAEAAKDWQAQRDLIIADFTQVDKFAKWFRGELDKNGRANIQTVVDCQLAAKACHELTQKVTAPVEETIKHLGEIKSQGETSIKRAAQHLSKTYENLQGPVMKFAAGVVLIVFITMIGLGWLIVKRNENQLDENLQQLVEYSEQQKTEMKELFGKAMEEARETQIDNEIKVKMWDELMKTQPPQQRQAITDKLRDQINIAERKRIDDQMRSSYEQMNGKRK